MTIPTGSPTAPGDTLQVEVRDLPAQDYLGKRFTSALQSVGPDVQSAFSGLYARITSTGAAPTGPPFLVASQPSGGKMDIEVGAPCAPVPEPGPGQHRGRLQATRAAVTAFRGAYEQIGPVYGSLFAWAARQGHRPTGPPREVYLNGPGEAASPAELLTELVLPID